MVGDHSGIKVSPCGQIAILPDEAPARPQGFDLLYQVIVTYRQEAYRAIVSFMNINCVDTDDFRLVPGFRETSDPPQRVNHVF